MPGEHVLSLEVIAGQNLAVPSNRTPAGHYVLVSTSYGQWNTAIKAAMADCSVSWNQTLTIRGPLMLPKWFLPIFSSSSKAVRLEIRASFEYAQTLGLGELVGTVETTLEELLAKDGHSVSFLAIDNQRISLKLKARRKKIQYRDKEGTTQSKIALDTDAARDAYTLFWRSNLREHSHGAIDGFQAVLDQCPDGHAQRAAALSNLAHAILRSFDKNPKTIENDIDRAVYLFRSALTLRPRGHIDHALSIVDLCHALCKRHSHKKDPADLCEAANIYRSILPLCVEGSHLHQVVFDVNGIPYVIEQCNALPSDPSDESISLRRIVLELCPSRHRHRAYSLNKLAEDLYARFLRDGNKHHIYEAVVLSREALAVCRADDDQFSVLPGVLSDVLGHRFNYHGDPSDLYESIVLDSYIDALSQRTVNIIAPPQETQTDPQQETRPESPTSSCLDADATGGDGFIEEACDDPYNNFFPSSLPAATPSLPQSPNLSLTRRFWNTVSRDHKPVSTEPTPLQERPRHFWNTVSRNHEPVSTEPTPLQERPKRKFLGHLARSNSHPKPETTASDQPMLEGELRVIEEAEQIDQDAGLGAIKPAKGEEDQRLIDVQRTSKLESERNRNILGRLMGARGKDSTSVNIAPAMKHPEVVDVYAVRGFQRLVVMEKRRKRSSTVACGVPLTAVHTGNLSQPGPSSQAGSAQADTLLQALSGQGGPLLTMHGTQYLQVVGGPSSHTSRPSHFVTTNYHTTYDSDSRSSIEGSCNRFLEKICFPRGHYH